MAQHLDQLAHDLRTLIGHARAEEVGAAISQAVNAHVPHDALRLVGSNPATGLGLGSFSFWHQYDPKLVSALALNRYQGGDVCRPAELARRRLPVAVAGGADDQRTARVLAAHGASSELRLLLRDAQGVWGMLGLIRSQGGAGFDHDDASRAAELGPALLALLRRYVAAGPLTPTVPTLPAGVIVVGADHTIRSVTEQAQDWLRLMWPADRGALPKWVADAYAVSLSMETRTHARDPGTPRPLAYVPPVTFGRWVTVHGQCLDPAGEGDVAIVIEAATGAPLVPAFCEWHGISPRERAVIEQLRVGAAPKQIARCLQISPHTVNDHLKAVFRKTAAGGRDELIAALTG